MQWRRHRIAAVLACLMSGLAGCSSVSSISSATAPAPNSKITLVTQPDINPDASGRPSPVPVRVYLLKSADRIARADYFQIIDHERDVLGSDVITREDVMMRPGESHVVVLEGQREEAAIGVVVGYRNIERASWRVISPIPNRGELTVTLDATRANLQTTF
jgi:type VI secretion system protein VasD